MASENTYGRFPSFEPQLDLNHEYLQDRASLAVLWRTIPSEVPELSLKCSS